MPLKGPSSADLRKIHAEVTQIVNQRFLITTLAITVFGVFVAWLIPRNNVDSQINISLFTIAGSMLLTLLLGALYLFNLLFLRGMLRIFTSYLIVTGSSNYEYDWQAYRNKFKWYMGYTRAQAGIFLLLGTISTLFPFFIALGYSLKLYQWSWLYTNLAIGIIYFLFVLLTGIFGLGNPEKKTIDNWGKLKEESGSSPDANNKT